MTTPKPLKPFLDNLYHRFHRTEYLSHDPVGFLHRYPAVNDREVVGMIAMAHALGRVESILEVIGRVLNWLGFKPYERLMTGSLPRHFFSSSPRYYRFFTEDALRGFLVGLSRTLQRWGSLEAGFGLVGSLWERLDRWLIAIRQSCPADPGMLLPLGKKSSPLKRPLLFLRWMVRSDNIDPGGWNNLSPRELYLPLDTHLFEWGKKQGIIPQKSPNRLACVQLTQYFQAIEPNDPCRYDFSLAQWGMAQNRGQKGPSGI
jgi:uncharacterized protein (TIGR02757 family)